jgi:AraC-like DNA-binding protein
MDNSLEKMEKKRYNEPMVQHSGFRDSFLHYCLPCGEEDEKIGMICTTAGSVNVEPGVIYPPRRNEHPARYRTVAEGRILPDFNMIYVTEGEGIFISGGVTYRVKPGSIMLILPGLKHAYAPLPETGWREYWVGFRGGYFSTLLDKGCFSPARVFFETGLRDSIVSIFNQIFDEVGNRRPLYQLKTCALIMSLIAEVLTRECRKDQSGHYEEIVAKAKYLMESNACGEIDLPSISERLGISTSRLNEIFKNHTSMTPYQYYIHIKIHKAEILLEQGALPVKEVAYQMGFEDQYYFSRLFKSKTGVSPSDWRQYIDTRGAVNSWPERARVPSTDPSS